MKYADGCEVEPGDIVQIDVVHHGVVKASMDTGRYLPGWEDWAYLKHGIMVDTSFGGLVHYTAETVDGLVLVSRQSV